MAGELREVRFKISADAKEALDAFVKTDQAQNRIIANTEKVVTATNHHTKSVSNFNMVGMNFNRIIQDSPYFLQSMQMGIMSIGNNIGPMVESLNMARQATGSWKTAVMSAFTGTGGIMTIISVGVSAITAWALANRGASKDVKEHAKEVDKLAEAMKKASGAELVKGITYSADELRKVNEELKKYNDIPARQVKVGLMQPGVDKLAAEAALANDIAARKRLEEQKYTIEQNTAALKTQAATLGIISNLEKQISEITQKKKDAKTPEEINKYNTELKGLNAQLDKYNDKVKNTSGILNSLENKKDLLQKAIGSADSLEKLKDLTLQMEKLNEQIFNVQFYANTGFKTLEEFLDKVRPKAAKALEMFNTKDMKSLIPTELKDRKIITFNPNIMTPEEKEKFFAEQRKDYKTLSLIADSAAGAIGDTFKNMWRSVFGEANNLLTSFLERFAMGFLDYGINLISGGIFKEILPNLSVAGTGAGPTSISAAPIVTNVYLGDQQIASVVSRGLNVANRLRF